MHTLRVKKCIFWKETRYLTKTREDSPLLLHPILTLSLTELPGKAEEEGPGNLGGKEGLFPSFCSTVSHV